MKIDAHIKLGACYTGQFYSTAEYVAEMEKNGIDLAIVAPQKPLSCNLEKANVDLFETVQKYSSKLKAIVRVNPWQGEDAIKMAERWLDRGFIGIHLFPWEETFQVNDKVVYPLVELAEDRNVPIVIEAGYPVLSHVTKIAALAQEFPKAKFYMTNAGQLDLSGDSLTDVQYFMHLIPNLHFGTSSAVAALWLSTLIAHPDVGKRIHFETNFPFTDVFMEGFRIDALSLSDEKRRDVFSNNTKDLFCL